MDHLALLGLAGARPPHVHRQLRACKPRIGGDQRGLALLGQCDVQTVQYPDAVPEPHRDAQVLHIGHDQFLAQSGGLVELGQGNLLVEVSRPQPAPPADNTSAG